METTWVKTATMLALGENNFSSHRAGSPLRPGLCSWRTEPQMRCWCCAAAQQEFKTLGAARRWGAGSWCCSWVAQTLTRACPQLNGSFLCSFYEAFVVCSTKKLWACDMSGISPSSSPHCVWLLPPLNTPAGHWAHGVCWGPRWPSAQPFKGFGKAPASRKAFENQLRDASALERVGILEIPHAGVSMG